MADVNRQSENFLTPMGLFNLVPNWFNPIKQTLDAKMAQTLAIGLDVARSEVHVISGYLQSTIGGEYRQRDMTIMLHVDAPYALIEETRGPTRYHSQHHYLAPAAKAMAKVWGGNLELHLPHANLGRIETGRSRGLVGQERKLYQKLGRLGRRTKLVSRRHHRRWHDFEDDLPGLIL